MSGSSPCHLCEGVDTPRGVDMTGKICMERVRMERICMWRVTTTTTEGVRMEREGVYLSPRDVLSMVV